MHRYVPVLHPYWRFQPPTHWLEIHCCAEWHLIPPLLLTLPLPARLTPELIEQLIQRVMVRRGCQGQLHVLARGDWGQVQGVSAQGLQSG